MSDNSLGYEDTKRFLYNIYEGKSFEKEHIPSQKDDGKKIERIIKQCIF